MADETAAKVAWSEVCPACKGAPGQGHRYDETCREEPPAATVDLHEPDEMGVHDEYSDVIWLPRSIYPKRSLAIAWWVNFTGGFWLDVRCLSRWMRYTPEGGEDLWTECDPGDPGAFRVWRLENA